MGRYILIEFDDKDAAAKLKRQVDQATKSGKAFRVVGYFAQPEGPYCDCDVDTWTFERGRPYAPSKHIKKTGWTKCLICGNYRDNQHFANLLGMDKVKQFATRVVQHYKTKQPTEVVRHILGISFINISPDSEGD